MKRYFKHSAESDLGEGVVHIEFTDGWPSRQVEVYGEAWRWADEGHNEWLADQPLDVLELAREHEIQAEDFERIWQEALKRCPSSS